MRATTHVCFVPLMCVCLAPAVCVPQNAPGPVAAHHCFPSARRPLILPAAAPRPLLAHSGGRPSRAVPPGRPPPPSSERGCGLAAAP